MIKLEKPGFLCAEQMEKSWHLIVYLVYRLWVTYGVMEALKNENTELEDFIFWY